MSNPPPDEVIAAIERGTSEIIRRIEFYEADGKTRWYPTGDPNTDKSRLVEGSISVDSSRDERRTLDLTLLNNDKLLNPNSNGGLWYDKVIKVFRGVKYAVSLVQPRIAIVDMGTAAGPSDPYRFKSLLGSLGFTRVDVLLSAATLSDVTDYDLVVAATGAVATSKAAFLKSVYNSGRGVITISIANGTAVLPFVTSDIAATNAANAWGISPVTYDTPFSGAFTTEAAPATVTTGRIPSVLDVTALAISRYTSAQYANAITGIIASNTSGGRWFDLHIQTVSGVQAKRLLKAGIDWTRDYQAYRNWEVQQGEFVIDKIDTANFPYQAKITGRDYTKRCLTSKFEKASSFSSTTNLSRFVRAIAANAGISKFRVPTVDATLGTDISVERGTERWAIMVQAANANNYELFFDNQGYLVMREYSDPALSPVTITFQTGKQGNLVQYSKSINDSRIYNHICVYGDPSDSDTERMPYFGEAKNLDPDSPTHIRQPGEVSGLEDRLYTFASTFFTSDAQAQTLAESLLKIHALESYEISFDTLYYPWLEAGEIVNFLDPDAGSTDPTRFLMDTITYPVALGPMSATGKRVTFVGDPNSQQVPTEDVDS